MTLASLLVSGHPTAQAPQAGLVAGRNVNMVSGTKWPNGDPYLQRQNEPSIAASTRNPLHLLAGSNDYRTVDIPFVDGADETGDAWLGLFKSFDGGQRWLSTLLPGYPQDTSPEGLASPLHAYQAGADPVLRAGTHGLLFYAGLVFDRVENGKSGVFVARYIDNNDKESGDPIKYLGTTMVATSPGGTTAPFLDKPWLAVDIPRDRRDTCTIVTTDRDPLTGQTRTVTQTIAAGAMYVAYTALTEETSGPRSEILMSRSDDCGATWTEATRVSRREDRINQGASIAIDPASGDVYVAWRRISPNAADGDAIVIARAAKRGRFSAADVVRRFARGARDDFDRFFEHKRSKRKKRVVVGQELDAFDQATSDVDGFLSFRTNAYPTLAIDGRGRIYLAWTERGFSSSNSGTDARIVMATSRNGKNWTTPQPVSNNEPGQAGHQIMPSLTIGGGRLVLVFYDLREDVSGLFSTFVDDKTAIQTTRKRHTIDLRASLGTLTETPAFQPSVAVSDYLFQEVDGSLGTALRQLQFNPPNLPMFKQGTAPFIGDYVDVALAPAFVLDRRGNWTFNTDGALPVFHAVWTDNRDVRQPTVAEGAGTLNPWATYTPPTQRTGASVFDPTQQVPVCDPIASGSRNQNIYTSRLTFGLLVGSPGNTKPLSPTLQRAFSVFAQNTTNVTKAFRLTIVSQPPGGRASFDQFSPLAQIDVTTPARSLAARTVYATSTNPDAQINVQVREITAAGGPLVANGLGDVILLNPDIANPDIANPDIANPDIANPDIANTEVYNPDIANPDIANKGIANPDIANPDIANPDIANPDIANPDIANPDIANPDIANVQVANPDIANPDIANPDIANPDIANPDIANPDIANPDIANATVTDVSWTITNTGNTAASYNANLFLAEQTNKICAVGQNPDADGCIATQLILRKVYNTPIATACTIEVQSQNILIANIANPVFVTPGSTVPNQNDPSATNATLWLSPGETAVITLRVNDPNTGDNRPVGGGTIDPVFLPVTNDAGGVLSPIVTQQAANTNATPGGTPTKYAGSMSFVQQPTNTAAGQPMAPAVQVQVRDQFGAAFPNAMVSVALGFNPGGATLGGTTSAMTNTSGIATFANLTVSQAGALYTLVATATGATPSDLVTTTSTPFDVNASVGSVTFIQQPTATNVGQTMTPAVQVEVRDSSTNLLPNIAVTLTFGANPGGATLTGGASTLTNGSGIATFAGLSVNQVASGYTLVASAGSVNTVSSAFNITPYVGSLTFTQQPTTTTVGQTITPAVQVEVRDQGGALMSGAAVTLAFGANPGGATLTGGASTPSDGSGIATFSGLSVNQVANAYTLVASAMGATPSTFVTTTPAAFDITPAAPTAVITSVTPSTAAAGFGQTVTIVGTGFAALPGARATFRSGATTLDGFIFVGGSSATAFIVRLPTGGFPLGPATVEITDAVGMNGTNLFPITVSATPGAPVVSGVFDFGTGNAVDTVLVGQTLAIYADGVDTSDATAVFTQGANTFPVGTAAGISGGGRIGGLFTVPGGLVPGPLTVQLKVTVNGVDSALSNAIPLTVPTPTAAAGGSGGSPFGPFVCPAGMLATAIAGRSGQDLDRVELICTPTAGGASVSAGATGVFGGADFGAALTAPAGSFLTGIYGEVRAPEGWLDTLGVEHKPLANLAGPATQSGTVGGDDPGGTPFSTTCAAGQAVVGIQGRSGTLIDQMVLLCK